MHDVMDIQNRLTIFEKALSFNQDHVFEVCEVFEEFVDEEGDAHAPVRIAILSLVLQNAEDGSLDSVMERCRELIPYIRVNDEMLCELRLAILELAMNKYSNFEYPTTLEKIEDFVLNGAPGYFDEGEELVSDE